MRVARNVFGFLICLSLFAMISSCKKEEPISTTPVIQFISITPNPAVKYQDVISVKINYIDGDGDIGENTPDLKNLFVTDNRNQVTYEFRINQLAPDNSNIAIQGDLSFQLAAQGFIDDSHTSEKVVYSIYVVDRAGHQSNTIQTTELTINQ